MSDWLLLYVIGCIAAFVLLSFNSILFWFIRWVTKTNILLKNMRKIGPEDKESFAVKVLKGVGLIVAETALSWLSVLAGLWRLIRIVLETLRDVLTPAPERIRALRFPLRNNPDLPSESVWAHVVGLAVLAGQPLTQPSEVLEALDQLVENRSRFDRRRALLQLQGLHVLDADIVSAALEEIDASTSRSEWSVSA